MPKAKRGRQPAAPRYKVCCTCQKQFCDIRKNKFGEIYRLRAGKWATQTACSRKCRRWGPGERFKNCVVCHKTYSNMRRNQSGKITSQVKAKKWSRSKWCSPKCWQFSHAADDAKKQCEWCGVYFSNRYKNGKSMGPTRFARRRVCSASCKSFLQQHKTVREAFAAKIGKQRADSCLYWQGTRSWFGHGRIELKQAMGRGILAHRLSYALFIGPVPAARLVCHACDVPQCVNPKHLYLGDFWTNGADRAGKPRPEASDLEEKNFLGIEIKNDDDLILTDINGQIVTSFPAGARGRKARRRLQISKSFDSI